ncbi:ICP22 family protein [Streptomyces antimycoticus]|uniref:hypothetical protein n=1 Tax=Streptomyces antimycoticus TaxID=68175 RepID=UPI0036CDB1EB
MKMIDPASIPEFTGDLEQLDKDVSGLRGDAISIRDGGMHAHSRFQMLEGFYTAPEADQLFASTWPAAVKADAFAGDLEKVADALDTFAYEIRPLVKRLKQLKADAFAFVDSVEGDDDWTEDEGKVDRHQQLWDGVNAAVAAFQEAERKASTTISGLVGGPKFRADDGSHTRNRKQVMYGYDLDSLEQAKELPWGSPVSQTYDALDFGHHFKSFVWDGLVVDNIWGGLKGLKTLTGLDGGDAAGNAWGHLGDVVGGIGQYTIKPYDAFMDWAFGEDQDSPDEARQKQAAKDFGKSLVAWDMWSENPARASATVVFNGLTLGAVPAARVIKGGKAGAAAQGAAKIGEYLDPLSATFKMGGKAASSLPKLSELTANTRALDNVAGSNRLHSHIELSDGSRVRIEDGAFIRLDADGNPVHDTPRPEPRAEQRASEHEAAPGQRESAEVGAGSRSPEATAHVGDGPPPRGRHDLPNSADNPGPSRGSQRDQQGASASAHTSAHGDAGADHRGADHGGDDGHHGGEATPEGGSSTAHGDGGGQSADSASEVPQGAVRDGEHAPLVRGSEVEQRLRDGLKGIPGKERPKPPTLELALNRLAEYPRGQEVAEIITSGRFNNSEGFGTVISSLGAKKELMFRPGADQILLANDLHKSGVPADAIDFEMKNDIGGDLDVRIRDKSGEVYGYQMKRLNDPQDPVSEITRGKNLLQLKKSSADHRIMLVEGQGTIADWQTKGAYDDLMEIHQGRRGPKGEGLVFVIRLDDGTLVIPPGSKTDPKDML